MALEDIFNSNISFYTGTRKDLQVSFNLNYDGYPIFERYFDGSDSSVVSVGSSTIKILNHFFVTGEKVTYSSGGVDDVHEPIGVGLTDFGVGIGTTNKLPSFVYIIKVDESTIKLARSAEDALNIVPKPLSISSVGIGTRHSFTSTNQNSKVLISIDNIIQSPIVSSGTTTRLSSRFSVTSDILYCDSTSNFFSGNLIKIEDEVMKIDAVGVGATNNIRVLRPWMGTEIDNHPSGSEIVKLNGDYNIVGNKIYFIDPPYGNVPISTTTKSPDERDWKGITDNSSFHGRVFLRSGITDSSNQTYYNNYIFDNISFEFDGTKKDFTLKSNKVDITDIYDKNGIVLINNIFQGPGYSGAPGFSTNYTLSENAGITSITFVGSGTSLSSDINTSDIPSGGIIVSVGSSEGFGYQPLISAGATATVSVAGTISAISIGNSGSGYRTQIQTLSGINTVSVRVGVALSSVGTPNIEFIGTASVSNGSIVSIAITNPGTGYTSTNPPYVIIDDPLPYSNIPLIYSSSSSGVGTQATINVMVGQGSSVIDFEIKNIGYGYKVGDILTVPVGGSVGIPTTQDSFKEFQIKVDDIFVDKFSGWTIGELLPIDSPESLFDGKKVSFSLKYAGNLTSIYAKKGSTIRVKDALLVFLNDILQIPDEGYIFNGGSKIQFTEAPKLGDTCKILFYRGTGEGVDVIFRNIIEPIEEGDELTLTYDSSKNQPFYLLEEPRYVTDILSMDSVNTNLYFGPGNTEDSTLLRPINLCRQTEDLIINGKEVAKNRILYEPQIYPTTYLIQSVGVGSTVIYVENIIPFFNPSNENDISVEFQKNITLISQSNKVGASATAIISNDGFISDIDITNRGSGYDFIPRVTIQKPNTLDSIAPDATASISSGSLASISVEDIVGGYSAENPPVILIEPPASNKETNKVDAYFGDSGTIVGFGTTVSGSESKIILDLFIPLDSVMRDETIVGTAVTISSISSGDFFIVYNSNVGIGTTLFLSLRSDDSKIGFCTQFIDTVYQVNQTEVVQKNIAGIGITYVKRIQAKTSGIGTVNFSSSSITFDSTSYKFDNNNRIIGPNFSTVGIGTSYFGNYSWGKIKLKYRSKPLSFDHRDRNQTSDIVIRTPPLRYENYSV